MLIVYLLLTNLKQVQRAAERALAEMEWSEDEIEEEGEGELL